jgi:hypothetical protein
MSHDSKDRNFVAWWGAFIVEYNDENIMYLVSTDTNLQLAFFQLGFSWTFFKTHTILKKLLMFKTVLTFWPVNMISNHPSNLLGTDYFFPQGTSQELPTLVYKKALEDHVLYCVFNTHSRNFVHVRFKGSLCWGWFSLSRDEVLALNCS